MITTHSSFFPSLCLRGSPKITHPHKQLAQAGKIWSPVRQWSLLRGWRHLTMTAVLPLAQLSCHAWMYFSNRHQPPLTNRLPPPAPPNQTSRRLHMSQVPQALPSTGFSLPWTKSEHPPASELHTHLFNLKERPLPLISRLCYFFYSVAFRGLLCSRNGKYFTSQQFVQEALTHSSIFQPCQPCDKA